MRGPSSYNGVRAGSLHSFGVPHFDQDSKHGHHPPLSEIQNYSVPGLIYTHQTVGSTQGNQGQYESASIYNDGIYLPYLHQDKNQVLFNQDGEGSLPLKEKQSTHKKLRRRLSDGGKAQLQNQTSHIQSSQSATSSP